jgi:hypothetical protein
MEITPRATHEKKPVKREIIKKFQIVVSWWKTGVNGEG